LAACALESQEQEKPGTKTDPQEWSRWFFKFKTHTHSIQEKSKTWVWYIISFIRIEKSPFPNEEKTARLTLPQAAAIERTKLEKTEQTNKTENTHPYEQKCESHTCSGTINSSMYESDLTTTTLPRTSSAPYSG
jgi:hypothetical protein